MLTEPLHSFLQNLNLMEESLTWMLPESPKSKALLNLGYTTIKAATNDDFHYLLI